MTKINSFSANIQTIMNNSKEFKKIIKQVRELNDFITNDLPNVVGTEAVEFAKDNFDKGGFNDASLEKWKPRKDKNKSHRILIETDNLRESLEYKKGTNEVSIISDREYANVHNEGLKAGRGKGFTMPQRKFIDDSAELEKRINTEITKKIKRL